MAISGKNIVKELATTDAVQTDEPIVQTCNAPSPNTIIIILISDAPLDFARTTFSLMFFTMQVIVNEVVRINTNPKIKYLL